MAACEECWTDAFVIARATGRHQVEVYQEFIKTRTHDEEDD